MAMFKPYKLATAAQLEQLPKVAGQFIVVEATGAIYYDKDTTTRINLAADAYTLTINGSTVSLLDGSNTAVSTATIPSVVNAVSWNNEAAPSINSFDCYNKDEIDDMIGTAEGIASLDATGKVPSTQLPSYVDDVVEYADLASCPVTGETGKIYVTLDNNKTYRWSGSAYVEISPSIALYTTTGQNTNGAMTQKAVTDLIGDIETLMAAL